MKRLVAFLCLAGLPPVPAAAEAPKPGPKELGWNKCTLKTCGCNICLPRNKFENDDLWNKIVLYIGNTGG
jgi:hypothetical protein